MRRRLTRTGGAGALAGLLLLCLTPVASAQRPEPADAPPRLDGRLDEQAWADATQHPLVGGGEALVMRRDGDLWLAVRGTAGGWAHVYLAHGDTVRVLHASAALGTAVYHRLATGAWERSVPFSWAVRDTSFTPEAEAARATFLAAHGWIANTNEMGEGGVIELRIASRLVRSSETRLAVAFASDPSQPAYWPETLTGGALDVDLVRGDPPPTLVFEPEAWAELPMPGAP